MAAVTARIGEIQSMLGVRPAPVARTAQPATAFARTLAEATTATAHAGAGQATATSTTPYAAMGPLAAMGPSVAGSLGRPPGLGLGATAAAAPASGAAPASAAASLGAYANGKIPVEALTPIGRGNHRLAAPAAAAFRNLEAAAQRDGVSFGVTDSYRSYESQVELAKRKGLYSEGGLAARPGTSDHGWGMALDLKLDAKAQAWMRANAPTFGFVEDVPREPWHWTYKPS